MIFSISSFISSCSCISIARVIIELPSSKNTLALGSRRFHSVFLGFAMPTKTNQAYIFGLQRARVSFTSPSKETEATILKARTSCIVLDFLLRSGLQCSTVLHPYIFNWTQVAFKSLLKLTEISRGASTSWIFTRHVVALK